MVKGNDSWQDAPEVLKEADPGQENRQHIHGLSYMLLSQLLFYLGAVFWLP